MAISAQLIGSEEVAHAFALYPEKVRDALGGAALKMAILASRTSVTEYIDGQRLAVQTGTLARSVVASPKRVDDGHVVGASFGTNVGYGVAYETGDWAGLVREVLEKQELRFEPVRGLGKKRPFLEPALKQLESRIDMEFRTALEGVNFG